MTRFRLIPCNEPGCNLVHSVSVVRRSVTEQVPVEERFWQKVDRSGGSTACWTWTATRDPNGYGHVWVGGRAGGQRKAHRVAWELTVGPIPDGAFVLHACDNPPCVNPDHLFIGTNADNMLDMVAKGRQPAHMRPHSRCKRGHPLTPDNVVVSRRVDGDDRRCRKCRNDLQHQRRTSRPMPDTSLPPEVPGGLRVRRSGLPASIGKPERFLPPLGNRLLVETQATPGVPPVLADGGPTPPSAPSPSLAERSRRTHLRAVHPGGGRSRDLSGALGPTTTPSG